MARKSAAAADASPATQPATDASLEAAPDIAGDRAGTPATTAAGASSAPAKYTAVVFTNAVDADGVTSWPFKRPGVAAAPSARRRNVKQILAAEHFEQVPPNVPTFVSIAAPPSHLPRPKVCDVTGLPANYKDPKTGLYYYSAEVYQAIKEMSSTTIQQYLALRGAAVKLG